jgi:hypothetical protein
MNTVDFVQILKKSQFLAEPFPHWIAKDVLDPKMLAAIQSQYPTSNHLHNMLSEKNLSQGSYDQNTAYSLEFDLIEPKDKHLIDFANDWSRQKNGLLDFIFDQLPLHVKDQIINVKALSFTRGDFRASSPVTVANTTQLGPHLDSPFEILAGLIYLKIEEDNSSGGDLEIYSLNKNAPARYMSEKRRVPLKYLDKIHSIPYKNNIGIFFISHPKAIHGVAPRDLTTYDRRVINLSIELPESSEFKMFNSESITDYTLTKKSRYKLIRSIQYRFGKYFNRPKVNYFGKYNWVNSDNL